MNRTFAAWTAVLDRGIPVLPAGGHQRVAASAMRKTLSLRVNQFQHFGKKILHWRYVRAVVYREHVEKASDWALLHDVHTAVQHNVCAQ